MSIRNLDALSAPSSVVSRTGRAGRFRRRLRRRVRLNLNSREAVLKAAAEILAAVARVNPLLADAARVTALDARIVVQRRK